MVKIKRYIERFFRNISIPSAYDMSAKEWKELVSYAVTDGSSAINTAFLYGYAKGYRACTASTRKGGDAA